MVGLPCFPGHSDRRGKPWSQGGSWWAGGESQPQGGRVESVGSCAPPWSVGLLVGRRRSALPRENDESRGETSSWQGSCEHDGVTGLPCGGRGGHQGEGRGPCVEGRDLGGRSQHWASHRIAGLRGNQPEPQVSLCGLV